MSEAYEKFLEEGGVAGWLGRNFKPMLPKGPVTLPSIKEKITQYLTGGSEKKAELTAKYTTQALRESGLVFQPQPSYEKDKKLDELYARIEEIKKQQASEKK